MEETFKFQSISASDAVRHCLKTINDLRELQERYESLFAQDEERIAECRAKIAAFKEADESIRFVFELSENFGK